jgi:hypothetical protein
MSRAPLSAACALASVLAVAAGAPAVAQPGSSHLGRLIGRTQISFGCPGPVREGDECNPWRPFPNARFQVDRVGAAGGSRIVRSDDRARFSVALAPGNYRIVPLPGAHTRGGSTLTVTIAPGATVWKLVRFVGFPMME